MISSISQINVQNLRSSAQAKPKTSFQGATNFSKNVELGLAMIKDDANKKQAKSLAKIMKTLFGMANNKKAKFHYNVDYNGHFISIEPELDKVNSKSDKYIFNDKRDCAGTVHIFPKHLEVIEKKANELKNSVKVLTKIARQMDK